jgi:hypothetical protein
MKIHKTLLSSTMFFSLACQGPANAPGSEKSDTATRTLSQGKPADSGSSAKKSMSFSKILQFDKISFHVYSPNNSLHNSIIIQPTGIKDSSLIQTGVIGKVMDAFAGDLNKDGFPEIYYVAESESGERNLFGYGSNRNQRLSLVYMPGIKDQKWGIGYRGHDEYKISDNALQRSFPVYSTDPSSSPTRTIRELAYHLVPGVDGWILKMVDVKDRTH